MAYSRANGYWWFARRFRTAAAELLTLHNELPSLPVYYLLCHAIELALKGFLITRGFSTRSLKGLGHDLARCLDVAQSRRLGDSVSLSADDERSILRINMYYLAKELEYNYLTGFRTYPSPLALLHIADAILAGIRADCRKFVDRQVSQE